MSFRQERINLSYDLASIALHPGERVCKKSAVDAPASFHSCLPFGKEVANLLQGVSMACLTYLIFPSQNALAKHLKWRDLQCAWRVYSAHLQLAGRKSGIRLIATYHFVIKIWLLASFIALATLRCPKCFETLFCFWQALERKMVVPYVPGRYLPPA